jgi:hypothetical protein
LSARTRSRSIRLDDAAAMDSKKIGRHYFAANPSSARSIPTT